MEHVFCQSTYFFIGCSLTIDNHSKRAMHSYPVLTFYNHIDANYIKYDSPNSEVYRSYFDQ